MKDNIIKILNNYKKRALKRKQNYSLAPRPLTADEVKGLILALKIAGLNNKYFTIFNRERMDKLILRLISEEVKRGSFPSSYAKAEGLAKIVKKEIKSDYLKPKKALNMLAAMKGGAATGELINILNSGLYIRHIVDILKKTVLISRSEFNILASIAEYNRHVSKLIKSWAEREYASEWHLQDNYRGKTLKVGDHITTGHMSPSKRADSRTDRPFHARYIMEGREDEADFLERWQQLKKSTDNIFLTAGKAFGEGSSRKSATFTMLQVLGRPVKGEPERKEGGIIVARSFAPIFKESLIASGILPLVCDTSCIKEGDLVVVDLVKREIIINDTQKLDIILPAQYKLDKIAAGGMKYFDAGNELQEWAISFCRKNSIDFNVNNINSKKNYKVNNKKEKKPQTLAQKIVAMNRVDGKKTIEPGETATVKVRGVFSQDTTGPMTINEYMAMGGGKFGADFVIQSLCHTGECPSSEERDTHKYIYDFITDRGGVCLTTGEGIIHTIGNRFVLPTDIIVGGDSHTRTPRGLSFPAASDIVAGVMKYGKYNITMDESVKVVFEGSLRPGITARDLVSTLVVYADKTAGKDIYNGRIIEIDGISFLDSEQKYILTNSVAERNASAGVIPADQKTLKTIKNNLMYLKSHPDACRLQSLRNAIKEMEDYLEDPVLPSADKDAKYAAVVKIPLNEVDEPLVAKPHHPDNVAKISEVSGTKVDEVFIGSCVGGDFGSIKAAAQIVKGKKVARGVNLVISPASRDIYTKLAEGKYISALTAAGATVIMPGCGLCMGNKRRIGSKTTAFTTTTRNYKSRIGPEDSRTYLGSAQIAAITALIGGIPDRKKYFEFILDTNM